MVKLIVDKKILRDSVKMLTSSVKAQPGAITSSVLFSVNNNTLTLKASDNFVFTSLELTQDNGLDKVDGTGEFTVDHKNLTKWLANVAENVVEINHDGNSDVFMTCGSVESPFPSKDPSTFPSQAFEKAFSASENSMQVNVATITDALTFIRDFVSTSTTNADPAGNFTISECQNSFFVGTDTKTLGLYKHDSLTADLKISHSQISAAISYLKQLSPEDSVTVKKTDNFTFIQGTDSSYFGFTKPRQELPSPNGIEFALGENEVMEVNRDELKQAIGALLATADPNDPVLLVKVQGSGEEANIVLVMKTYKGSKPATVSIPCTRVKENIGMLEFTASHELLTKALSSYSDTFSLAYCPQHNYLKLYEVDEHDGIKMSLLSLMPDMYR